MRDEKLMAEMLIRKFQTNDPFQIAKEMGIIILYENLKETFGYFNKYKRFKMIHINQNLQFGQKKFVCSHELGHAIYHPDTNTPFLSRYTLFSTDKIERQANTFAVEILLPDDLIREFNSCSIFSIARTQGIPESLVQLKSL